MREREEITGTVYALLLEGRNFYIGFTKNWLHRFIDHFSGKGSVFTSMYPPVKILERMSNVPFSFEKDLTKKYISLYGINKVRGSDWSFVSKEIAALYQVYLSRKPVPLVLELPF